ncbi:hypothetical protein OROMI_004315 [Orobanche minor]
MAFGMWARLGFKFFGGIQYSFTLIQNSAETLLVVLSVEASIVIPLYSLFRHDPHECSAFFQKNCVLFFSFQYVRATMRGLLSLPAVWVDQMGNVHGRCEGLNLSENALLIGSHLDTVIDAGIFDGALGVINTLSALKVLNSKGMLGKLHRPVEYSNFGINSFVGESFVSD